MNIYSAGYTFYISPFTSLLQLVLSPPSLAYYSWSFFVPGVSPTSIAPHQWSSESLVLHYVHSPQLNCFDLLTTFFMKHILMFMIKFVWCVKWSLK